MQVLVIMIKTKTFLKQKKKSFHCDSAPLQPFSSSSSPLSPLLPEDILVSQTSVVRFWSLLILILSPARLLWVFITRRQSETRSSQTEDKDTSYISSPHFTEVPCSSEQTLVGFWLEVNLILHLDWYCSLFLSVFNSFLVPVYIYFSAKFYKWNQIFYISLSVFNNDLCCKCSVLHGPVVVFDWVMLVSQGPELFSQTLAQCVCVLLFSPGGEMQPLTPALLVILLLATGSAKPVRCFLQSEDKSSVVVVLCYTTVAKQSK